MKSKISKKMAAFIVSAALFAQSCLIVPLSASAADMPLSVTKVNTAGNTIKSIEVSGSSNTDGRGIVAVYKKDGTLKGAKFTKNTIKSTNTFDLSEDLAYDESAGDKYMVFIWEVKDDKLTSKPLANAYKPAGDVPTSAPVTDTPVTDTPVTDTPVTDTPVTDTPVTDTPVTDTPVTDTPVTDTPVTDTPVTDTPVTDTPVTDTPVTSSPTPTQTPVPKYTVSGTVDANVASVILIDKTDTTKKFTGTIAETTVTFADVPAGTYTITATAQICYEIDAIKVDGADATEVTVTDANVTNLAITSKAEEVIPYADGTITYDNDGDTGVITGLGRCTVALSTEALGSNTTKFERFSPDNGKPRAQYVPYANGFPLTGDAVTANFDFVITGRPEAISLVGKSYTAGEADDNNGDTGKIFTISVAGLSEEMEFPKTGNTIDGNNTNSNSIKTGITKVVSSWYHIESVSNMTTKKVDVKLYAYKANNNYTKETALYSETLDFRDNTVTGVVGLMMNSNSNYGAGAIDNIYFNDPTWVAPIYVTATDATFDKPAVRANDVITITPTIPEGKKVTAVKVNGVEVTPTTETTGEGDDAVTKTLYKYTVKADDTAIAITAEFARADVTEVIITSQNSSVQKGNKGTYTAAVKAGNDTLEGQTIAWSLAIPTADQLVEGKETAVSAIATNTKIANGALEVDAEQAEGVLLVTASVVKNVTAAEGAENNTVVGIFKVNIVGEPVYQVEATDLENGSVSFTVGEDTKAEQVKQSEELEIVPAPNAGYSTSKVEYIKTEDLTAYNTAKAAYDALSAEEKAEATEPVAPTWTEVAAADGKYKVAGMALKGDITVKVTYTAIPYTITNANATADANGNSIAVKLGENAATEATVGQDIVVVPTVAEGSKLKTLTYTEEGKEPVDILNTKTFKMPANNVTINAEFDEWDGLYASVNFDGEEDVTIPNNTSKDIVNSVGTWKIGGTASTSQTKILSIAGDNTLKTGFTTGSGKCFQGWGNNTHEYVELTSTVSTKGGLKIIFDTYFGNIAGTGDAYLSIGDADPTKAALHLVAAASDVTNIKLAESETVERQKIYYYDVAAGIYKATGIATASAIHVEETINADGSATVVLKSGETTKTITLATVPEVTIGRFNVQGVRVDGDHKGTALIALDNILITAPWYTAYDATVTVKDNADTPTAIADADITIKKGDAVYAIGKTNAEGKFTANLPAGTYTVTLIKDGFKDLENGSLTVAKTGENKFDITMEVDPDPPYTVTVKTAPFATVKLKGGPSTAGTQVAEQTVTADKDGVATLLKVRAGTYKADITPANKYWQGLEDEDLTVAEGALEISKPITATYKAENMIFGDNFSAYQEDTFITGGAKATENIKTDMLAPLGTKYDIWTLVSSGNDWERLAIRGSKNSKDPALIHNNLLDGHYAYFGAFNKDAVYTGTVSEDIDKIVLDTNLDGFMGSANTKKGMTDTQFKFGDKVLFTLTAKPTEAEASIDTIGIKTGEGDDAKVISAKGAWVHVEITGLTSGTATVKITKYASGTALSEEAADTITATIEGITAGKVFTISAIDENAVDAGQSGGGMALDNVEIYKAAATTTNPDPEQSEGE